jgi:HAMP domain-containing protein
MHEKAVSEPLRNLVKLGQLQAEASSPDEIAGFLQKAAQRLQDAQTPALSSSSRFTLAYDAAHALALAALRLHDLRPGRGLGHRSVAFQSLAHTVNAPQALWSALNRYHSKRNQSEYGGLTDASEAEAKDITALAAQLQEIVRSWVRQHKPDIDTHLSPPPKQARAKSPLPPGEG